MKEALELILWNWQMGDITAAEAMTLLQNLLARQG